MTRVADTSVLYAFFDADDVHHDAAVSDLGDPEPIVVPTEVLAETIDLVVDRALHEVASAALEDLLALPHVSVMGERVHVSAVQDIYQDAGGALSLTDAFVVQACRVLGARPLAYDDAIVERVG